MSMIFPSDDWWGQTKDAVTTVQGVSPGVGYYIFRASVLSPLGFDKLYIEFPEQPCSEKRAVNT